MFKFLTGKNFTQSSTYRGLALIASSVAFVMGYGHIFSAELTTTGVQFGGVVGTLIPAAIGAYDVVRDEFKRGQDGFINTIS